MSKLKNGQLVTFDNGVIKGKGIIKGLSNRDIPILGVGYIVEVTDGNIPNSTYQYESMIVFNYHLKKVD